ncbi:MAG: hypothetical protein ACOX33_02655 [Dethiobacteria bacterium]
MTGTKVTGWAQGILSDTLAAGAKVEIRSQLDSRTTLSTVSKTAAVLLSTPSLNYWGHTSGPRHATTNTSGQGNEVSNNVNYNPWHQDEEFRKLV